jgi:hypothetical protein
MEFQNKLSNHLNPAIHLDGVGLLEKPSDPGKLSYNQIDSIFSSTLFSRREQQVLSQILDWASQINAEEHARLGGCVFTAMTEAEINRLIEATFVSSTSAAGAADEAAGNF